MEKILKALYSSNRNPFFRTFTEYIEHALQLNGCETLFFENRQYLIPGRIRDRIKAFHILDLKRMNRKLLNLAERYKPDILLEVGGWNILPETIDRVREREIKTILWTNDAPRYFQPIQNAAPHYDYVFTQGSEAYEILEKRGVKNLYWLPYACDPDYHKPRKLTEKEREAYGYDVAFVGSIHPHIYPFRVKMLEAIASAEFNLGVWGPGAGSIPSSSPLTPYLKDEMTSHDTWTKIYTASKINICMHYKDPEGIIPCYQASPRVYEVMACGGFLLVDNQPDVLRTFRDGEHLVVYNSINDLIEKLFYYLKNPEKRMEIARKGREEVLKKHTFSHRIKKIMEVINGGHGFSVN
jgi:spore maturation protein CgeB